MATIKIKRKVTPKQLLQGTIVQAAKKKAEEATRLAASSAADRAARQSVESPGTMTFQQQTLLDQVQNNPWFKQRPTLQQYTQNRLDAAKSSAPSAANPFGDLDYQNRVVNSYDREQAMRASGKFDNEAVIRSGYGNYASTEYIQKLLDQLDKMEAESIKADELAKQDMADFEDYVGSVDGANEFQRRKLAWLNEVTLGDSKNPSDQHLMELDRILNGEEKTDAEYAGQRDRLLQQYTNFMTTQDLDAWLREDMPAKRSLPTYQSDTPAIRDYQTMLQDELDFRNVYDSFRNSEENQALRALDTFEQDKVYVPDENVKANGASGMDALYAYINDPAFQVAYEAEFARQQNGGTGVTNTQSPWSLKGYDKLSDDEKAEFTVAYHQGEETARRYLSSLEATGVLNRRRAKVQTYMYEQLAADPVGQFLAYPMAALTNIQSGMLAPLQMADAIFGDGDYNSYLYDANRQTSAIRTTQAQMAGKALSTPILGTTLGELLYNGSTALVDNLAAVALSGGYLGVTSDKAQAAVKVLNQTIMGSQVASNTLYNELESGTSSAGAVAKAAANALIEAATERYSIEALLSDPSSTLGYLGRNMLAEGSEEAASAVLTPILDGVISTITGDKTELERTYNQYLMQGYSKQEATQATMLGFVQGLAADALIGGFVGGVSAAPVAVSTHNQGKQMKKSGAGDKLMEIAQKMPEGSKSRKLADKITRTKSSFATAQLYNTLSEEMPDAVQGAMREITVSSLARQLKENGETEAETVAKSIVKLLGGEELTAEDYSTLAQSKTGVSTLDSLSRVSKRDSAEMKAYDAAYKAGFYGQEAAEGMNQEYYQAGVEAAQKAEERRLNRVGKVGLGKGGVSYIGTAVTSADIRANAKNATAMNEAILARLAPQQRNAVAALQGISRVTGMNFVLYEGQADAGGDITVENGRFDSKTNTIYLDLNSGKNRDDQAVVNYAVLRTAAHEMTHFIEANSKDGYAALKKFVVSELTARGKNFDSLVQGKIAAAQAQGQDLTMSGAVSEVVADACEMMLKDTQAIRRLAKQDKSLYGRIKSFLRDLMGKIRKALEGVRATHTEARALMEAEKYIDGLQKLWDDALVEAVETARAVDANALEDVGAQMADDGDSAAPTMMSLRTWTASEYMQNREKAATELVENLGVTKQQALKWIDDVNGVAKMIADNRELLDYEANEYSSAIKSNAEYGGSVDFSTICAKRRLATGTMDAIQRMMPNTVLTQDDIFRVRNMMIDKGLEVACGLCYVESARKDFGRYAKAFLDEYKATNPEWIPDMADVNTVDGLADMRREHPEAYAAYEKYMNRLAQRKPKLYEKRTEYRNEILSKFRGDKTVESKNRAGGFRIQSFSDFEAVHLLDMMQVVMDMSNVGLAGQAYTKVADFAWAMGDTGVKINLSMIAKGVDKDGHIVYDEREGMKVADAKALRDRYSKNVGTILVVFSDKQLKAALNDDFVDFIIPFHRSQWNKKNYASLGLPTDTQDFTSQQNERYIRPHYNQNGKKIRPVNYAPNAYWDYSKTGKENAETYLRMCAEDGRRPKFAKLLVDNGDGSYSLQPDGSTDGYWKLLIDFKMYDNSGEGSPQMPVTPSFNMEEVNRIIRNYQGGHAAYPVAQDVVDEFVKEYRGAKKTGDEGVQFSNREAYELSDADVSFSIREEAPPKKTGVAYKVFYQKNGKLYPPMVANPGGEDTPVGVWLNADVGVAAPPSKTGRLQVKAGGKGTQGGSGSLAFRPGWHLGDIPKATQFDRKNPATGERELFPYDFVWAECEYAMDVDYQEEAMSYGYTDNGKFRHSYAGLPRLPVDGYYHYRTNPDPKTVPWVITGAMKVNRILSRTEVDEILAENGVEPTKWQGPDGQQMEADSVQLSPRDVEKRERAVYRVMKNGFYNALSRYEWRQYYEMLNRPEYNPDLFDDGEVTVLHVNDKVLIAEMQNDGEFEVFSVFQKTSSLFDYEELFEEMKVKYERNQIEFWLSALENYAEEGLFRVYDQRSRGFSRLGNRNRKTQTGYIGGAAGNPQNAKAYRKRVYADREAKTAGGEIDSQQQSLRETTLEDWTEQYLERVRPADIENPAEADALRIYHKRLAEYRKAKDAYDRQVTLLESGTLNGDDLIRQQNRVKVSKGIVDRYEESVKAARNSKTMQALTQKAETFVQHNLMGKDSTQLKQIILNKESEIRRLKERIDKGETELKAQREQAMRDLRLLKSSAAQDMVNMQKLSELSHKSAAKVRHIQKGVKRLHDLRVHETDYRNIPEDLKAFVGDVVTIFGKEYGSMVWPAQKADQVVSLYQKLNSKDGPYAEIAPFYDPDMLDTLLALSEWAKQHEQLTMGKGMTRLERAELRYLMNEAVADLVDHVNAIVRNSRDLFNAGRKQQFAQIGTALKDELMEREDKTVLLGKPGEVAKWIDNAIRTGNITPVYFFDQLGIDELSDLYNDFRQGQEDYAFVLDEAKERIQSMKDEYGYNDWKDADELKLKTSQGHEITLTKEQALWLYATWNREQKNDIAKTQHLTKGGFVYEGNADPTGNKGLFKTGKNNTTGHLISEKDMAKVNEYLTDAQKAYADAMVDLLSTDMAALGNRVSMEMFGIRKYKEKYYFPYKTVGDQLNQTSLTGSTTTADDSRLKHGGFTHALTRGAQTALVMGNFSDVVANHVSQMATYSSFVLPIENLNRVLNYRFETDDGSRSSIRSLIRQKFGENALRYIEGFLHDMNGGVRNDSRSRLSPLVSLHKKAAVAASLSVALQQPSSILRAAAMMNPKYLMQTVGTKADYEELKRHSGIAIIKQLGRFDTNVGKSNIEWLLEDDYSQLSVWQKARQALNPKEWENFKNRWSVLATGLPNWMDERSWATLWKAVKAEQADKHPGMDHSSNAFLDMCGKRFNDIVDHTQVYDSVLAKSPLMRSKNDLDKMVTSFAAEPTLTLNMLYDAFTNKHHPERKKRILGTMLSITASSLAAAIGSALISAWNKDKDDRTAQEKLLNKTVSAFVDNMNPLNNTPYIRDLYSLFQGYEVERADMSIFSDIVSAVQKVQSDNYTGYRKVEELAGSIANLTGVPLKNVMRDLRRIYNAATSDWTDPTQTGITTAWVDAVDKAFPFVDWYETGTTDYYERQTDALLAGDSALATDIERYMREVQGKKDKDIRSGVKSAVKDRVEAGGLTTTQAIDTLTKAYPTLKADDLYWEYDKALSGDEETYGKYDAFFEAVETGNNLKAEIQRYLDNGVTKQTLAGRITDNYKPQMKTLYETDKKSLANLQARLLTAYELLGYNRTQKLKDIKKWYE